MGKDFYDSFACSKEIFDKANEVLDIDVKKLCFEENEDINITEYTQAAMVTASVAILKKIEEMGLKPDLTAGLSLGEYCALVASDVMSFEAADLSGVLDVGAAAELGGPALNINNTDDLAVLLAEQSHSAQLLGLFDGHFLDGDVHRLEDLVVDDLLHAEQLLGSDSAEVGKVEVRDLCILIGACLMHMVAQHFTQRCLQQMGGGVRSEEHTSELQSR